ncbi:mitotic spindle assembly checkpoint protein MAD2B-like isoform X2 [Mytilus galloprovincialis]|uniref:mitotic spindle assembly checkpoint protein MAD2B-like isoform X2 n=1 Tax=Mytilus galloprovincialis TaxID=29158 RepID=UPI003F7C5617
MTEIGESQNAYIGADIFCEFLEVAIHCILYTRELYPAGVFEKKRKFNVPVKICVHPEVLSYVTNTVDSIRLLLKENAVFKVTVVVVTPDHKPAERFVFEVARPTQNIGNDKYLYRLEESLRGFLLKLSITESLLKTLPEDCTWTVQVYTRESAALAIEQKQHLKDFPWILADERETTLEDAKMIPLKAVNSDYLQMQLYAEESSIK